MLSISYPHNPMSAIAQAAPVPTPAVSTTGTLGDRRADVQVKQERVAALLREVGCEGLLLLGEENSPIRGRVPRRWRSQVFLLGVAGPSTNRLKLRRYLSTRRPTAPPKLEVNFRLTRVAPSGHESNETTPAARFAAA